MWPVRLNKEAVVSDPKTEKTSKTKGNSAKGKPPKPAPLLKKPIPEKKFLKDYVKLIEQERDRAFLQASFELKDGTYTLKQGLDKLTMLRLNKLAKAIKANRGFVKTGPLILLVLLIAGLSIFYLFFMNPLLERTGEQALQALFGARAEISSFKLDLFKLRVSMDSLEVADRDSPMKNLFQSEKLNLNLNPASLLRGKIYIEKAESAAIQFGSPRKTSGALPDVPQKAKARVPKGPSGPPLVDFENFDANALLEREKDKLKTSIAYADAEAAITEATLRWQTELETSKNSINNIEAASKQVLALNPKNLNSVDEVLKAGAEIQALSNQAQDAIKEASRIRDGAKNDLEMAKRLEKQARSAINDDIAYLRSYIDPKSGTAKAALEPSVREILSDKLELYIAYGQRALEVAETLKEKNDANKKAKPAKFTPKGRNVIYPSARLPLFRLGLLSSNFKAADRDWTIEFHEISSDPDLVKDPTRFHISVTSASQALSADAIADMRQDSKQAFSVVANGEGLPVNLGSSLKEVGIGSLRGRLTFVATVMGSKDRTIRAQSDLRISETKIGEVSGTIALAIADALSSVDALRLDIGYTQEPKNDPKFSLDSNLDELIAKAIREIAGKYAKEAAEKLEKALRDYVGAELEGKLASKEELDAIFAAATGDKKAADFLKARLEAKRTELETRAKTMAEEAARKAVDQVVDKAKDAATEAAKKVDIPKVDIPKAKPPKVKF
ncbi:hypothetical protein MASR2M78_09110 [Treponema sp.]